MGTDDGTLIERALEATQGLSQTAAAEVLGVSQLTVSRWRRGQRRALWGETRSKLEAFLRCRPGADREPAGDGPCAEPELEAWADDFLAALENVSKRTRSDLSPDQMHETKAGLIRAMIQARAARGLETPPALHAMLRRLERTS